MGDDSGGRNISGKVALFVAAYALLGLVGLNVDRGSGFACHVWPASGLAVAVLAFYGPRLWPGVLIGAGVVAFWAGAPVFAALGVGIGNTLAAVVGAYFVRRIGGFRGSFNRLSHVVSVVLGGAVFSTAVSATVGTIALRLSGAVAPNEVGATWCAWWLGDALGVVVVGPLFLSWATRVPRSRFTMARVIEIIGASLALVVLSYAVFLRRFSVVHPLDYTYVLFPPFVWISVRFGLRGTTLATALTSSFAIWGTALGLGRFAPSSASLLVVQAFMACMAVSPLVIASVLAERGRAISDRDTVLAIVSHDLKNPLNSVLMSAELLLQSMPGVPVRRHHGVVLRSTNRMMRLIADLLDASSIDQGQLALRKKTEDVHDLAAEALEVLRPLSSNRRLRLEPAEHIEVSCDRERLVQVLTNLVGNAIKFSPDGSTIDVSVGRLRDGSVRVSVRDRGAGMDRATARRVFERYWHTNGEGGGTGLGLFISRGIVEAHRGRIWVESEPGVGTTFHFTLPGQSPPDSALAYRSYEPSARAR